MPVNTSASFPLKRLTGHIDRRAHYIDNKTETQEDLKDSTRNSRDRKGLIHPEKKIPHFWASPCPYITHAIGKFLLLSESFASPAPTRFSRSLSVVQVALYLPLLSLKVGLMALLYPWAALTPLFCAFRHRKHTSLNHKIYTTFCKDRVSCRIL